MSANQTTLTGDLSESDLTFNVASATGATVGRQVRIDNEKIGAIVSVVGLSINVRGRGDVGTKAVAHNNSASVVFGDPSDFPPPNPTTTQQIDQQKDIDYYVADGAIAIPSDMRDTTAVLTKGSAGAYTLANPSVAQDGLELTLVGGTDFAHVVTSSVFEGTTGGAHLTLTSAAFAGSTLVLKAFKGRWYQKSNALWVLT